MKKQNLFCLIFSAASTLLSAQSSCLIGLHAGITQSQYATLGRSVSTDDRLPFYGLNFGASMSHDFKEKFYWQAGLRYTQLGERILVNKDLSWGSEHNGIGGRERDPSLPHRLEYQQRTDYLSIRVGVGYYLWYSGKFNLGLMPFAEANFFLSDKNEQRLYYDNGKLHSSLEYDSGSVAEFRSVNASAGLTLSFQARMGSRFDLFLAPEASYQLQSATVKTATENDTRRYFVLGLSAGIFYRL